MFRRERESGDPNNLSWQKGLHFSLEAIDPLTIADDQIDRKQFMLGFVEGIRQFIKQKGIQLPMATHLEDISFSESLLSYSQGLRRQNPKIPENIFGEYNPDDLWTPARNGVVNLARREGYLVGFLVGVAKDFGLILNQYNVPDSDMEYKAFMDGVNGEPFNLSLLPNLGNLSSPFDLNFAVARMERVYDGGVKIRSKQIELKQK